MAIKEKTIFWFGLMLTILLFAGLFAYISHTPPIQPVNILITPQTLGNGGFGVISPAWNDWLDTLKSRENCPEAGIMDSNGLKSYGAYCYQMNTLVPKLKEYREILAPYAEDAELGNFTDERTERLLTYFILKDHPEEWWRWRTTIEGTKHRKGIGKPPSSEELTASVR